MARCKLFLTTITVEVLAPEPLDKEMTLTEIDEMLGRHEAVARIRFSSYATRERSARNWLREIGRDTGSLDEMMQNDGRHDAPSVDSRPS